MRQRIGDLHCQGFMLYSLAVSHQFPDPRSRHVTPN
ncbi:hypothetical protein JOF41_003031 [Saccharothrix coeruleofusca]|nr:hypothetical protein [Saccharothrix coeruleofusca]